MGKVGKEREIVFSLVEAKPGMSFGDSVEEDCKHQHPDSNILARNRDTERKKRGMY
jgi:hypothetical protein